MIDKKYELTDDSILINDHILYRIKALRAFSNIKVGDLGGFIESKGNLSHIGDCWILDDAQVSGNATVSGVASVSDNARVYGNTRVFDHAQIFGDARVYGRSLVCGNAQIYGNAQVSGRAMAYIKLKLDHGIWNKMIRIDNQIYIISTTLQMIKLG
jgi:carbonic anhydrase/acetyltransferase-like protein (isoleucine patch superfamily)